MNTVSFFLPVYVSRPSLCSHSTFCDHLQVILSLSVCFLVSPASLRAPLGQVLIFFSFCVDSCCAWFMLNTPVTSVNEYGKWLCLTMKVLQNLLMVHSERRVSESQSRRTDNEAVASVEGCRLVQGLCTLVSPSGTVFTWLISFWLQVSASPPPSQGGLPWPR